MSDDKRLPADNRPPQKGSWYHHSILDPWGGFNVGSPKEDALPIRLNVCGELVDWSPRVRVVLDPDDYNT